jgi:sugar (pentulose or hexulose) kinase
VRNEQRLDLPLPIRDGPACEQNPDVWWDVCQQVLTQLLQPIDRQAVRAIAIDGTSGTVLLTDAHGQALTTALMYNDARASEQLKRIQQVAPANSPVNAVTAGLPKILWLAEQAQSQPVRHIMHQADWLSFQFTQRAGFSDSNNCLKTGYDPLTRTWPNWLQRLGIPQDWLPTVRSPAQPLGPIAAEVARSLDLPTEVLTVSGTTDSTAAIFATGAQQVGDAVTSLGSTLVCKVISDKPVLAPGYGIYSQPFGDNWLVGGASNSGGAVLRQYFTDTQMQQLSEQIDPEQATGLDYYPLPAQGERFPVNDPSLQPRLTPRPDDDAIFFQGLLEGIAQIEYNAYRLLHELGAPYPASVRSVGGGAQNPAWTLIRSRQLKTNMYDADHTEAAYGSALLARQGFSNHKETRS